VVDGEAAHPLAGADEEDGLALRFHDLSLNSPAGWTDALPRRRRPGGGWVPEWDGARRAPAAGTPTPRPPAGAGHHGPTFGIAAQAGERG
jgi:hypothetical protein